MPLCFAHLEGLKLLLLGQTQPHHGQGLQVHLLIALVRDLFNDNNNNNKKKGV